MDKTRAISRQIEIHSQNAVDPNECSDKKRFGSGFFSQNYCMWFKGSSPSYFLFGGLLELSFLNYIRGFENGGVYKFLADFESRWKRLYDSFGLVRGQVSPANVVDSVNAFGEVLIAATSRKFGTADAEVFEAVSDENIDGKPMVGHLSAFAS